MLMRLYLRLSRCVGLLFYTAKGSEVLCEGHRHGVHRIRILRSPKLVSCHLSAPASIQATGSNIAQGSTHFHRVSPIVHSAACSRLRSCLSEQAIQLTEEDLEPTSARADVSGKAGWMGPAPNTAGMRSPSGPPIPAGVGQSPSVVHGPETTVGDSVNELPPSTNGPGASLLAQEHTCFYLPTNSVTSLGRKYSCHTDIFYILKWASLRACLCS